MPIDPFPATIAVAPTASWCIAFARSEASSMISLELGGFDSAAEVADRRFTVGIACHRRGIRRMLEGNDQRDAPVCTFEVIANRMTKTLRSSAEIAQARLLPPLWVERDRP